MSGFLKTLFEWPAGIVDGNLIASAMWAAPALIHLHLKINRNHRELKGEQAVLPAAQGTTYSAAQFARPIWLAASVKPSLPSRDQGGGDASCLINLPHTC